MIAQFNIIFMLVVLEEVHADFYAGFVVIVVLLHDVKWSIDERVSSPKIEGDKNGFDYFL